MEKSTKRFIRVGIAVFILLLFPCIFMGDADLFFQVAIHLAVFMLVDGVDTFVKNRYQ